MTSKKFSHPLRLLVLLALSPIATAIHAESASPFSTGRIVMTQADQGAAPMPAAQSESSAASAHADHDAPASQPAVPDVLPGLNKKRVAFWGVTFMVISSLVFTVFGAWAIWKTPKPGQQRPDSYEKKRLS